MTSTDRYGLPVTTTSSTAFDRFQEGVDDLLAYGPGAEERFAAALAADERLALAHVGRALLAAVQGDAATARAAWRPPRSRGRAPPPRAPARPWRAPRGASGSTS